MEPGDPHDATGAAARTRIVVPCYDEATRFDAPRFDAFLAARPDVGFVLVNDGSRDGTLAVLEGLAARWPDRVAVVDQQPNQGKAEAVRQGLLRAIELGARYVGYWDADLATPLDAIPELAAVLDQDPSIDLVLGARVALLGRRIERSARRHYLGRIFATAASVTLAIPVYDTQCGAKMLRNRPALRALLAERFGSRWIFDVELIARYLSLPEVGGRREGIFELPLREWRDVGESKVKPSDFGRAVGEMAAIFDRYPLQRRWPLARALARPFGRYALAGLLGTLVHLLLLTVLALGFAAPAAAATVVGAAFGAAANYLPDYHFAFVSRVPHRRALPRFGAVAALGAAGSVAAVAWAEALLAPSVAPTAMLLATAAYLPLGYLLNRTWTFAAAPTPTVSPAVAERPVGRTP